MNRIAFSLLLLAALAADAMPSVLKKPPPKPSKKIPAGKKDVVGHGGNKESEEYSLGEMIDMLVQEQTMDILFMKYSATVNKTVEATPKVSNIVKTLKKAKKEVIKKVKKDIPKLDKITKSVGEGMKHYASIMIEELAERKLHAEVDKFITTELAPKMKGKTSINVDELLTNDINTKFETTITTYVEKQAVNATMKKQNVYAAAWKKLGTDIKSHLKYDLIEYIKTHYKNVKVMDTDSGEEAQGNDEDEEGNSEEKDEDEEGSSEEEEQGKDKDNGKGAKGGKGKDDDEDESSKEKGQGKDKDGKCAKGKGEEECEEGSSEEGQGKNKDGKGKDAKGEMERTTMKMKKTTKKDKERTTMEKVQKKEKKEIIRVLS